MLGLSVAVPLLIALRTGDEFNGIGNHLIGDAVVAVLVLPLASGESASHSDHISLVAIVTEVLSTLPPRYHRDEVGCVLDFGSLDGEGVGAYRDSTLRVFEFQIRGQSASKRDSVQINSPLRTGKPSNVSVHRICFSLF